MIVGKRRVMHVLLLLVLSWSHYANAGDCAAHAERGNVDITEKGNTYVDFTVTGKPCKEGCDGWVKYRIHLLDKKRATTWYSGAVKWAADLGEPVEITDTGYKSFCHTSEVPGNFGPCEVQGVEIVSISCGAN